MAILRTAAGPLQLLTRNSARQCFAGGVPLCIPASQQRRRNYSQAPTPLTRIPDFAFAFDIDGVLLRSSTPIPGASEALTLLHHNRIPFILLTNGGGKTEQSRIDELSSKLRIPSLSKSNFIQSHTPFADLATYKGRDKTILVLGGDEDKCRSVAEQYGFENVVVPADLFVADETLWPFSRQFLELYRSYAKELPRPLYKPGGDKEGSLKIDAVFVYNDPRDWGLDATLILDLLLSERGIFGTLSEKNGDTRLPNKGYQQDGQPKLYFSNPDLWWAAKYHLPRLGQGGFREALEGLWAATTGGVELKKKVIGKPYAFTYAFAEGRLVRHREEMFKGKVKGVLEPLKRVYMIGDNPESDIRGGNEFQSPVGTEWWTALVRTGVHRDGEPKWKPKVIVDDVYEAVRWALNESKWPVQHKR